MFGNPVFRDSTFKKVKASPTHMTVKGTARKTAFLVLLTMLSAANAMLLMGFGLIPLAKVTIGAALLAFVVAVSTTRKPPRAVWTGMVYALLEGVALGGATLAAEQASPGVLLPTLLLTFMVVAIMLGLWSSGRIDLSPRFVSLVGISVWAFVGTYVVSAMMWTVGIPGVWLHANPVLNVIAPIVAALCLLVDFQNVQTGVDKKAPAYMEWYAAFGITVTTCWLYLELLGSMGDS